MDLNKLVGYNRGGAQMVDMEDVVHAMPRYGTTDLRAPPADQPQHPSKPADEKPHSHSHPEHPHSSSRFWSTVMNSPPASARSSAVALPHTSLSFRLGDASTSTTPKPTLSSNTAPDLLPCDRDGSEGKP